MISAVILSLTYFKQVNNSKTNANIGLVLLELFKKDTFKKPSLNNVKPIFSYLQIQVTNQSTYIMIYIDCSDMPNHSKLNAEKH